ncbi:MAG: hypothetical protein IKW59_01840 [Clostridia bacterium]|nr:hypothetical protein [Clostridia bacterium]
MKKGLKSNIVLGIIFVSVLGTLFHFIYEWSGNNVLVGLFAPVNESIWEHTKLMFFPMLIYSVYLNKQAGDKYPCITSAMLLGTLSGVALIIILFYTYSGIIGTRFSFVDISIFYISVITAFYIVYKATISCSADKYKRLLQLLTVALIGLYIIFTFFPPDIALFANPLAISE